MDSSVANRSTEPGVVSGGGSQGGLKKGSIGLAGLVVLGAVMMSPALGIYGLWGPIESTVGVVTPLVFLAALAVALPTAVSYSLISRSMPSTGSAFSWVWTAISPTAGLFIGLMMAIYYTIAVLLQPLLFGLFFNDLLSFCGVDGVGTGTILLGAALVTVPVVFLTYRGIEASTKSAIIFILVEVVVVVALAVTIIVTKGSDGDITLAPFDPSNAIGGISAFWTAMILGILAFTGFDVISTVAEEAEAPRRLLPKATILAALLVGVFWAATSWAFSISEPVATVQAYTEAGTTAVTPLADHYWGWGRIFVILTGMTAATACYVATAIGASRSIFAIARHGQLPAALGKLHPRFQSPWNAMHVVYLLVAIGAVILTLALDNAVSAFTWWASALVFFALIVLNFVSQKETM